MIGRTKGKKVHRSFRVTQTEPSQGKEDRPTSHSACFSLTGIKSLPSRLGSQPGKVQFFEQFFNSVAVWGKKKT